MPLKKKSQKLLDSMRKAWLKRGPKNAMRRPFPLIWGIVSLALFACFAVVTQVQFNRINSQRIYDAQLVAYDSDFRAYEAAVQANAECISSVEVRNIYRNIFLGVEQMFESAADLPMALFPWSAEAASYRETMLQNIREFITTPVAIELPSKTLEDCPPIPPKPERPNRD